jgi:hypothetical protein
MDVQEKKAFEIAFDNKLGARGCQFDLDEDGNYEDRETLCGWHMWLEVKAQAVPEGFVLVPKEPTDKTIAHMINTPIEVNLLCDHADVFLSEGEAYIAYQAMIEAQEPSQ